MFRKTAEPLWGDGGGLKFEKKNARKQLSPHLRKKIGHTLPFILYFSLTPNPITKAQQPRDWSSPFNFSESGRWRGGGHNYYSLALLLLDYMGFATEASMGAHTPAPQPWDWE